MNAKVYHFGKIHLREIKKSNLPARKRQGGEVFEHIAQLLKKTKCSPATAAAAPDAPYTDFLWHSLDDEA